MSAVASGFAGKEIAVGVVWFGEECNKTVESEIGNRIRKAGIHLKNEMRKEVSRSQPTAGAGSKKRGLDPSKPEESPKKVRGHLRRNITDEFDAMRQVSRVGTNVKYGRYLETGTNKMKPRPWIRNTLQRCARQLRQIIQIGKTL